jgi:hypothetical protein
MGSGEWVVVALASGALVWLVVYLGEVREAGRRRQWALRNGMPEDKAAARRMTDRQYRKHIYATRSTSETNGGFTSHT